MPTSPLCFLEGAQPMLEAIGTFNIIPASQPFQGTEHGGEGRKVTRKRQKGADTLCFTWFDPLPVSFTSLLKKSFILGEEAFFCPWKAAIK